jgi:hypothetical protein
MARGTIQPRKRQHEFVTELVYVPASLTLCRSIANDSVGCKSQCPLVVSKPFVDRPFALD